MHVHDDLNDIEYSTAMRLQAREITDEQMHKFEGYASEIFAAFGLDLNTPATRDTPRRFIKALFARTFTDVYRDSELIMHILCGSNQQQSQYNIAGLCHIDKIH